MIRILLLFFLYPFLFFGQGTDGFTFTEVPKDLQLYARNSSNFGDVVIDGAYNRQIGTLNYDGIRLKVNGERYGPALDLTYVDDESVFDWTVPIEAGLINYKFLIQAKLNGAWEDIILVEDVVAGDVYIINGQSNAEANEFQGRVETNPQLDQFIRVYASGIDDDSELILNDNWYLADGNGDFKTNGNTGQWGFKLGQLLVEHQDVPIAIFNGSRGGKRVEYFLSDWIDPADGEPTNNYQRLLYRLNQTNLKSKVKAIFWSQGENTKGIKSIEDYKGFFEELLFDWNIDYNDESNLEQIYIFQTINGCNSLLDKLMFNKEAQRQIADEPSNKVQIMTTDGLNQVDVGDPNSGFCHFAYSDGYENFATRIYELVEKDIYKNDNNGSGTIDITAPMITDAYLTSATSLVVETNANSLTKGNYLDIFSLEGTTATIIQNNIQVFGNKIYFDLSADPGNNAYLTNSGAEPGVINNFITNSRGIEIVSFLKFPISRDIFAVDDNLMFTQYYHDNLNTNKWLEIKNISNETIPADVFFVNLFENNTSSPSEIEPIPELQSGEVILFYKNGFLPTEPNIADVIKKDSKVCSYDGTQAIAISTSFGNHAYDDRVDMLGDSPGTLWGRDKSFVKSDNNSSPDKDFEINNWINIESSFVDDVASTDSNVTLGSHNIGSTSWDGSDWTNHVAGPARTVNLSNNYNANDGTLYANDLTITANLDFDKGTTNSVVVHGDLDISGGTLTIGDEESLVMYKSNALISGEVTKLENSSERNNIRDFTYWSSPVISTDAKISSVFPGVESGRIFYYDQSRSTATESSQPTYWDVWQPASGNLTMTAGVGFASEGVDDDVHRISFTGEPNNGDISVPIVFHDDGERNDFNLIGNPYPSAININDFFTENQNVDVAYLWTHNTQISGGLTGDFTADDYATINQMGGARSAPSGGSKPKENIGSGQGFFVNATSGGSVTFTNSMRLEEANDQFFKSSKTKKYAEVAENEEKDRIWLDLRTDEGGFSQILLGFKQGLTNKVDHGYDAPRFSGGGNPITFYSIIDNEKYVIQGKRTFISLRKFKLGFDTTVAPRTFSISISEREGVLKDANVYLVDKLLNITHDLNISNYTFVQETTGAFMDRFLLKFEDTAIPEEVKEGINDFVIINGFNDYIAIKANNKALKVSVHDMYGNKLMSAKPKAYKFVVNTRNFDQGSILIISVKFENGEVINKKTIKF